ncbi:MAG: hypothetical protein U5R48_12410 [Gammaproteobacteria bacterium]|nr:hypothetical protein [Gammaproteobacteria bacterium]
MAQGLHQLTAEDPALHFDHQQHLKQLTLSGQGDAFADRPVPLTGPFWRRH